MAFDIHQQVFDEDGEYFEEAGFRYRKELEALFEASVEAKTLEDEGIEPRWVYNLMDLGMSYQGVTPAQMSATDLRIILFDLIPRKISAKSEQAPEAIREFQLFWTFLQREFHLENAAACLEVLNEKSTVRRMREEMENPANFGMAKSLVMMGLERGFDVSSQEGMNEWAATYNAELADGTGTPIPLGGTFGMPKMVEMPAMSRQHRAGSSRKSQTGKAKRKMVKSSRKQNRTKK